MPTWTSDQVASLAPDPSSVVAARGLARPSHWTATGHDDRAVWGRCRGYAAGIDLTGPERPLERGGGPERPLERGGGPAFSCSCPSRKIPCKHALGLLLLFASQPEAVPPVQAPAWVEEWLEARTKRAARAAPADKKPVDPEARARRTAERAARIGAGLEELDLWLRDLVRQGLASAQARPFRYWDEVAARMVDAQAPGIGGQVRRMAGIVRSGEGWPGRLLVHAGRLHLVTQAWARFDTLPPETQADLRTVTGWSWNSDEVLAGPAVRDRWMVVARSVVDEERFRISRTWLRGVESARTALILEFVPVYDALPGDLVLGTVVDADLAFFPGAWPQRALVARTHGEAEPMVEWLGAATIDDALTDHAHAVAANPWLDRLPMVLSEVVPVMRDDGWRARDTSGAAVRLLLDEPPSWTLAALSGGQAVGLAGEWQDGVLRPLSIWADRRLFPL